MFTRNACHPSLGKTCTFIGTCAGLLAMPILAVAATEPVPVPAPVTEPITAPVTEPVPDQPTQVTPIIYIPPPPPGTKGYYCPPGGFPYTATWSCVDNLTIEGFSTSCTVTSPIGTVMLQLCKVTNPFNSKRRCITFDKVVANRMTYYGKPADDFPNEAAYNAWIKEQTAETVGKIGDLGGGEGETSPTDIPIVGALISGIPSTETKSTCR